VTEGRGGSRTSRASALLRRSELPIGDMVMVGTGVLTITGLAFFRVPLLPSIGEDLSMSTTQLGALTATYAVGRLATDVPAGAMADRLPAGSIFRRAGCLVAAGSAAMALAPTAVVAYAAIFVLGVGTALTNTTGAAYFSTVAPVAHRGMAVSGFAAAQLGGQAFGPAVAGLLATLGGWRMTEGVATGIAVALVLGLSLSGRDHMAAPGRRLSSDGAGPGAGWILTPSVRAVLYFVPFVLFLTIGSMIQTLGPVIGDEELGLTAGVIGLVAGLGGLSRFLGAVVGGQVADRVARKAALVPGLLVQAAGVALLAVGGNVWTWGAAIVLLSLGSIGTSIAIAVLADIAGPTALGSHLGRFRFAGDLGLIAGPLLTAQLYDSLGKAAAVLPVAALALACAVAVALVVPETRWGPGFG